MSKKYTINRSLVCIDKDSDVSEDKVQMMVNRCADYDLPASEYHKRTKKQKSKLATPTITPFQNVVKK